MFRGFLYSLLYHQFVWSYDFVAAIVSLGRWYEWVEAVLPFMGGRVLEIGFGTGHLQISLIKNGFTAFGVDASRQMVCQASHLLNRKKVNLHLACAYTQYIPFSPETFDTVVATFPSDYIFNPLTLQEIRRVLVPSGRFIILPVAWISGKKPVEILAGWLYRVLGFSQGKKALIFSDFENRLGKAGFEAHDKLVTTKGGQVQIIVARKG